MSQQIVINVDDPADILAGYGVGALVRLERASSADFASPTEITTLALNADVTQYEYWDAGGTESSWYRSRYSAAGGSPFSGYSDGFQPGAPTSYATLDSLREYLKLPNNDQDNLLTDLLRQASAHITAECGRDFYRHPTVSGEETRLVNGEGSTLLEVPTGILSLSAIRLAGSTGGDYTALVADDWAFYPAVPEPGMPYEGIELTDIAGFDSWYAGYNTVELTGVFGFAAVPPMIEKATLDLAREWYRQGPGGGGPVGVNQFGTPLFAAGMPLTVKTAIRHYGVRSFVVV